MGGYVFVSYSRSDETYLQRLTGYLEEAGVDHRTDSDIDYGNRWARIIEERIENSAALVLLMTASSADSVWVERELALAQRLGKPVLPLLLQGRPLFRVAEEQYLDVTTGELPGVGWVRQLQAVVGAGAGTLEDGQLWTFDIVQQGTVLPAHEDEVRLHPAAFMIRCRMKQVQTLALNASDQPENFEAVRPGIRFDETSCFAGGMGMAEADYSAGLPYKGEVNLGPTDLWLGLDGHHYINYQGRSNHRWSRTWVNSDEVVLERDVARISRASWNPPPIDKPLERLYLVALLRPVEPQSADGFGQTLSPVIRDDSLIRRCLVFEP